MANIADITWSNVGLQFSEAERAAAVAGTTLPPGDQYINLPIIPPVVPILSDGYNTGRVDPDQMFADGFQYVGGRWVRNADVPAALESQRIAAGGGGAGRPATATIQSTQTVGGTVLGTQVPTAPPNILPSWVGGRLGVVRRSGGMRPESGGTPRIVKGIGPRPRWLQVFR
jgi:hypothetical protein